MDNADNAVILIVGINIRLTFTSPFRVFCGDP